GTGRGLLLDAGGMGELVAEAGSPAPLVQALARSEVALLLTAFLMPGGDGVDGLDMLSRLRAHWPRLPVVVLTMAGNPNVLQAILGTGVRGLLDKSDALPELSMAIAAVANGRSYIGSGVRNALDAHMRKDVGGVALSRRETEVLR